MEKKENEESEPSGGLFEPGKLPVPSKSYSEKMFVLRRGSP
jgi:hypothetical protein